MNEQKAFVCGVCDKSFRKISQLNRHMVSHSDDRPYECEVCSKRFKLNHARRRHQRQVHTHELPFTCGICNKGFHSMYPLEAHLLTHVVSDDNCKETPTSTDNCKKEKGQVDISDTEYSKSVSPLTANNPPSADALDASKANHCGTLEFASSESFSDALVNNNEDAFSSSYLNGEDKKFVVGLADCPMTSDNGNVCIENADVNTESENGQISVQQNFLVTVKEEPGIDANVQTQGNNNESSTPITEQPFEGDDIFMKIYTDRAMPYTANNEWTLSKSQNDLVTSDNQTPKRCPICDKEYRYTSHFERHILSHRIVSDDANLCKFCGKRFTQKSSLRRHMILHSEVDPFVCEFCNKAFKFSYSLQIHRRIHTGHKPYTCEVCNKPFSNKPNLDSHFRIHTGEKPYECETCGRLFRQLNGLQHHSKTHRESRICDICGLELQTKAMAKAHLNIHKKERNFVCNVCNKRFLDKRSRNRHIKVTSCKEEGIIE